MRFLWLAGIAACIAAFVACGGAVEGDGSGHGDGGTGGSASGAGGTGLIGFGGTGGKKPTPVDSGRRDTTTEDAGYDTYVDPPCPDARPNPPINECDPFSLDDCGPGYACYPYVDYPTGRCEQEQYGTLCSPTGSGQQGDPCGAVNCAQGFVCVTGTGQGVICVKMCHLDRPDDCPPGLLCGAVDVAGIGGCY